MYDDLEPEIIFQADDAAEEYPVETAEFDVIPPVVERLYSWLEIVDN